MYVAINITSQFYNLKYSIIIATYMYYTGQYNLKNGGKDGIYNYSCK